MSTDNKIKEFWESIKPDMPKEFAKQLTEEITQITHPRDKRIIFVTAEAFGLDMTQKTTEAVLLKAFERFIDLVLK